MNYVDAVNNYSDRNADYARRLQYAIENELGNLLLQLIREAVRAIIGYVVDNLLDQARRYFLG
jgi:hypothetical protein